MKESEFCFRDKVSVGILGATGSVGQKFVQLLSKHPWFEITALAASERSVGKKYGEATNWLMPEPLSPKIRELSIEPCQTELNCTIVFSALDASVAGDIETKFAEAGYIVVSNARNHRMDPTVPLLIPEVNSPHLELLKCQKFPKGKLITNPNCAVIGLCIALKPLAEKYGLEAVHVVTFQSLSGR